MDVKDEEKVGDSVEDEEEEDEDSIDEDALEDAPICVQVRITSDNAVRRPPKELFLLFTLNLMACKVSLLRNIKYLHKLCSFRLKLFETKRMSSYMDVILVLISSP